MPRLPRTFKKTCPMGRGRSELRISPIEGMANEVAMSVSQPRVAVPITDMMIAIGAAFAAFDVSSEI